MVKIPTLIRTHQNYDWWKGFSFWNGSFELTFVFDILPQFRSDSGLTCVDVTFVWFFLLTVLRSDAHQVWWGFWSRYGFWMDKRDAVTSLLSLWIFCFLFVVFNERLILCQSIMQKHGASSVSCLIRIIFLWISWVVCISCPFELLTMAFLYSKWTLGSNLKKWKVERCLKSRLSDLTCSKSELKKRRPVRFWNRLKLEKCDYNLWKLKTNTPYNSLLISRP